MSLLDTIKEHLDGDTITKLAAKVGIDPEQAKAAIKSAVPTIVGALAKNTKSGEGADKLDKALGKHEGGVLAKLQAAAPDLLAEGQKILGHILGGKKDAAAGEVAKAAGGGLSIAKVQDLLAGLAPVVMGALGQKKKTEGLDAAGVAQALQADGEKAKAESGGLLSFLDKDGDGNVLEDVLEKGKSLLGGLLGGDKGGLLGGDKKDA